MKQRGISDLKGPASKIMFIMAYASKEDSGEPVHVHRLTRACTARKFKEMKKIKGALKLTSCHINELRVHVHVKGGFKHMRLYMCHLVTLRSWTSSSLNVQ